MIKLIVIDVDGTLTDGGITYTNGGEESKTFDVKDGLAMASWTKLLGRKIAIVTGRESTIVEKRAQELKIEHLYQGVHKKDEVIEEIMEKEGITWDEIAAIGDDLNDYKMLKKAGISFCPSDASKYVIEAVNVPCKAGGGKGAVREMVEYIIKEEGLEEALIKAWL